MTNKGKSGEVLVHCKQCGISFWRYPRKIKSLGTFCCPEHWYDFFRENHPYDIPTKFKKGCKAGRLARHLPNTGSFHRGMWPHNKKPIGTVTIRNDRGVQRAVVKVAHGLWRLRSVVVWEKKHNRTLLAGHVVLHKDGNSLNDAPQNLTLISRGTLMSISETGSRSRFGKGHIPWNKKVHDKNRSEALDARGERDAVAPEGSAPFTASGIDSRSKP